MPMPDWFTLLEQWKKQEMGERGPTLPFIVGALAYKEGQETPDGDYVRRVLKTIVQNPVEGYVTQIQWCHDIDAPVLSTWPIDDVYRLHSKVFLPRPSGEGESVVFSDDLRSPSHLDSNDPAELLERLTELAMDPVSSGHFSIPPSARAQYGEFSRKDLEYIRKTIMEP